MNALEELALERLKVARRLTAPRAHAAGSYNNRKNNQFNESIQRNLNALNANKNRLERELVNLRRRLMNNFRPGSGASLSSHNVLIGVNSSHIGAGINRLRKKKMAPFVRRTITRPSGVYPRMIVKSIGKN